MRTESRNSDSSALAARGLRDRASGVGRWFAGLGPGARVALVLALVGGLGLVGVLSATNESSVEPYWVFEHRKLSATEVDAITEALDAENIDYEIRAGNKIGVAPSRKVEALAVLNKRKVTPATLDDLKRLAMESSPWDGPAEREQKQQSIRERELKLQIEALDGIRSAHVVIQRSRSRGELKPLAHVQTFVRVGAESGRELRYTTVRAIQELVVGQVPELKRDGITLMDESGRTYLTAGNPSHGAIMQTRAREEELRSRILEHIPHIRGIGITVRMETVTLALPNPSEPEPIGKAEALAHNGLATPSPASSPLPALPARPFPVEPPPPPEAEEVRVNQPLSDPDLEAKPLPIAAPTSPPPAPGPPPNLVSTLPPIPAAAPTMEKVKIWARIPRSYYVNSYQSQNPGKALKNEDLLPLQVRTEQLVKQAVAAEVSERELGSVQIETLPDDPDVFRSVRLPAPQPSWQNWAWGVAIGATSALAVMSLAAGFHRLATRRPEARPSRSAWRDGYAVDEPEVSTPAPSERVRELVRQNPEAAAGVLHRWIGQGGPNG